ncbi:hypothetical protein GobsT_71870 [Gemmata obscuriglobus]|uniref:Prepilin-type cleavage/methylation domain-containing protein n=1 Tax=Gemmata obscuriglobus TaxID=114 RepID=A0A2Z3H4L3_9BACT|nr:type II secretion system protein [Gemmata obscuriglobus]AWM41719.1 prepilin-type cleavage/methylation domain-containing protein [Gemmata obscuriglobus]QEG32332.1 hypothetical protein GobsT_71870 [Gemmata obscuriglobus]VTS11688.1 unnamed protein product [Gemmata obscuriglobus UQM 2246]
MTTRTARRRGFTLLEVLLVMAVLILLAAVILPGMNTVRGDSRQYAAVDAIRTELGAARSRAALENRPYRLAIDAAGNRLRRAPDGDDFAGAAATDHPDGASVAVDFEFERATAEILSDPSSSVSPDGWQTIAVVLPAGTCLDDTLTIGVRDRDNPNAVVRVNIRGLNATARIVTAAPENRK